MGLDVGTTHCVFGTMGGGLGSAQLLTQELEVGLVYAVASPMHIASVMYRAVITIT